MRPLQPISAPKYSVRARARVYVHASHASCPGSVDIPLHMTIRERSDGGAPVAALGAAHPQVSHWSGGLLQADSPNRAQARAYYALAQQVADGLATASKAG